MRYPSQPCNKYETIFSRAKRKLEERCAAPHSASDPTPADFAPLAARCASHCLRPCPCRFRASRRPRRLDAKGRLVDRSVSRHNHGKGRIPNLYRQGVSSQRGAAAEREGHDVQPRAGAAITEMGRPRATRPFWAPPPPLARRRGLPPGPRASPALPPTDLEDAEGPVPTGLDERQGGACMARAFGRCCRRARAAWRT